MQVADLGPEPRFVLLQTSFYYFILIETVVLQPCDRACRVTNNRYTTSSQPVGIKKIVVYLLYFLTSHDEMYMGEMTMK